MAKGILFSAFYGISSIAIAFFISIASARLLGVDGYGELQFVLSITQIAQVGLGMGMATQVLRSAGEERQGGASDPGPLDVLIRRSVLFFLFLVFLVGVPGLVIWSWMESPVSLVLLVVAAAFVVTQHLISVYRSALIGKSRFIAAGFGEFLAGISALTVLGGGLVFFGTRQWDPALVLLIRVSSAVLGSFFLYVAWRKRRLVAVIPEAPLVERAAMANMFRSGFPIMLIGIGSVLSSSADIILLGIIRSSSEVAAYHVATRAAGLIGLPLAVTMVPLSPIISKLHRNNRRRLRYLVFRSMAFIATGSFIIAITLVVFHEEFFGIFGSGFVEASKIAVVLGISQFLNAAFGPMQQLLIMAGFGKKAFQALYIGLATNIVLNVALIPTFGPFGAAIGTGVGIVVISLLNTASVWSELFSESAIRAE